VIAWTITEGTLTLAPANALDHTGLEDAAVDVERALSELCASAGANFQTGCVEVEIADLSVSELVRGLGHLQAG
jgi:hypothetical protein